MRLWACFGCVDPCITTNGKELELRKPLHCKKTPKWAAYLKRKKDYTMEELMEELKKREEVSEFDVESSFQLSIDAWTDEGGEEKRNGRFLILIIPKED